MSQDNFSGYAPGNQQFSPQPQGKSGGGSAMKIVLIIVGVLFGFGLLVCGALALLLIPAVGSAREAAKRMQDSNNLKMVGLAMWNYESTYKKLPAPVVLDVEGKPVYSGYISILPFVEEVNIYNKVDFKNMQPWDSPSNSALQGPTPMAFRSVRANDPADSNAGHVFLLSTPYKLGGPNTAFSDGRYTKVAEFTDGTSNTLEAIMLVKYSQPWAKPATLTPDEAFGLIQKEDKYVLGLLMDGSVVTLPTTIDRATFDAIVTRDGGEVADMSTIK